MLKNYETKINIKNEKSKSIDKTEKIFKKEDVTEKDDIKQTCKYCSKKFNSVSNCNRHVKKCKYNKNDNISKNENLDIIESIINKFDNFTTKEEMKDVKNQLKDLTTMIKNLNNSSNGNNNTTNNVNNTTNNVNNTTNNVNIQINNNCKSKRDKLNDKFCDGITLDTFLENNRNDPQFEITKDEAKTLLENSENLGIISYSEGLFTCLKKKYSLQLEKIKGIKQKYYEVILPFICSDVNLRTHFEFNDNEWNLVKSIDKIKNIVTISDQQIFKHHNRFVCYSSKRGKNTVVNVFLRKSDFIEANKILEEKTKKQNTSITQ